MFAHIAASVVVVELKVDVAVVDRTAFFDENGGWTFAYQFDRCENFVFLADLRRMR